MNPADRDILQELLEKWFLCIDSGEQPDLREHCADRPELAPELARLLERAGAIDDLFATPSGPQSETAPPPERLGDFELITPIGSGGAGEVYLARQLSLRRLVALKVLKTARSERNRQRLRREAEVAASLSHSGIVPIYAVGEDGDTAWIAMKWLTGPALDGLDRPIAPERAATIAAEAAHALSEAHQAGIIHRDIKPSNIVLDGESACIVDFGLARDSEAIEKTTVEGHVAGTLLYMSPEQLRSGGSTATLDARTDVYSLGATLYELLTGTPPFVDDNPGKVIHQILTIDPPPPQVATDLATIVMRALDKDRERRFPDAMEMAADLERFLAGEPILSRPTSWTTRTWKLARRNRTATTLLASALFLAGVLAAFLGWNMRQQTLQRTAAIVRVEEEIDEDHLAAARTLLDPLLANHGDGSDIRALQRTLHASEQLETLLDDVQSLPEDADFDELRALATGIDGDALRPHRRLSLQLSRAMALAICGDSAAARREAEQLPPGRGRDAILAALESRTGKWQLVAAQDPIEHLFTALAMRLCERPLPVRRAEIELGRSSHPADWRLRLQHAIHLVNEGHHELADQALQGLPRDGGYPRIVHRLLLFVAIQLGRDDEANDRLLAFEREHPRESWSAVDAAYVADARYWLHRPDAELLAFARARWPHNSQIGKLAAREALATDIARAVQLLEQSVASARTDKQRNDCTLALLYAQATTVPAFWQPWFAIPQQVDVDKLRELASRAATLAAADPDGNIGVTARVLQSRALLALGEFSAAREALAHLESDEPQAVLERAQQAVCHHHATGLSHIGQATDWHRDALDNAEDTLGLSLSRHLGNARSRLPQAIAELGPRQSFHRQPAETRAWILAARLAQAIGDDADARTAIAKARTLLAEDQPEMRLLDWLEQQLDR